MFEIFSNKNFRIFYTGILLNDAVLILSPMIMGWVILSISDSPLMVGMTAGLGGCGLAFFSPFTGALIDRLNKRNVMVIALICQSVISLVFGLLLYLDSIQIWQILLIAFLSGSVASFRLTCKLAIPAELVREDQLLKASATNFFSITIMAIIAPIYGGWVLKDVGFAFAPWSCAVFLIFSAVIISRVKEIYSPQIQYGNTYLIDLMEGMKSLFSNKKVRLLIMIVLTSETFGWSVEAILPIIARDELGVDSIGLGYLMSAGAVGASITSLLISLLPEVKNKGLMVTVGLTGFGLCLILFSTSDIFWISTILLGFTYAFGLCYETSINTMLQTTVSPSMRGRALSFQTFGWGFSGMAGFMTGTIAMFLGAPIAVAAGGTVIAIQGIRTARKMFNIGVSSID